MTNVLAGLLCSAAMLAPLFAQDFEVEKYLDEIRPKSVAVEQRAERQQRLESLTKSLETAPNSRQKVFLYLQISELQEGPEAAIAALRKARELSPKEIYLSIRLAEALHNNKHEAEASEIYRTVLGTDAQDAAALMRRAAEADDLDIASACAELALKLQPGDREILDKLGLLYLKKGRPDAAILDFEKLVQEAPEVSTYHYRLGMAFSQKGFAEYARTELETALKFDPSGEERAMIEKLLDSTAKVPPK